MPNETFKVIIAGSRAFNDYEMLKRHADYLLQNKNGQIEIVSGHAKGADSLGERYAKERGYSLKLFPAKWEAYGKRAGYLRNEEMANYADALIAFWDGESKGTEHMINFATEKGLNVRVRNFK